MLKAIATSQAMRERYKDFATLSEAAASYALGTDPASSARVAAGIIIGLKGLVDDFNSAIRLDADPITNIVETQAACETGPLDVQVGDTIVGYTCGSSALTPQLKLLYTDMGGSLLKTWLLYRRLGGIRQLADEKMFVWQRQ